MKQVKLKPVDGQEMIDVIVQRHGESPRTFDVVVYDRPETIEVAQDDEHAGRLIVRGRTIPYRFVRRGDVLHLWIDGRVHEIEIVPTTARRVASEAAASHTDQLTAPMPGTILRIARNEGESYDAHEPIIIMESMKMEMTLSSPSAGVVRSLHCAVGDLVELGAMLVQLDPVEA